MVVALHVILWLFEEKNDETDRQKKNISSVVIIAVKAKVFFADFRKFLIVDVKHTYFNHIKN